MFLLIRLSVYYLSSVYFSLHSTMFLLILAEGQFFAHTSYFTFHNVSINTLSSSVFPHNPSVVRVLKLSSFFTFHNVSINTRPAYPPRCIRCNFTFHNVSINTTTRYLCFIIQTIFTFHNVSINTGNSQAADSHVPHFTFHNVSINTEWNILKSFSIRFLYIPQCCY